jgi:methionine-rich copper-binding protein CopC
MMRVLCKRFVLLSIAVSFLFAFSPGALAHTSLTKSDPGEDSVVVDFPDRITLEFNEPLLVLGENRTNYLEVIGPTGESIDLESLPVTGALLSAKVTRTDLLSGDYIVRYRVVAGDGHVLRGEFGFTFTSASGATTDDDLSFETSAERKTSRESPSTVILWLLILATGVASVIVFLRSPSGEEVINK